MTKWWTLTCSLINRLDLTVLTYGQMPCASLCFAKRTFGVYGCWSRYSPVQA